MKQNTGTKKLITGSEDKHAEQPTATLHNAHTHTHNGSVTFRILDLILLKASSTSVNVDCCFVLP